MAWSLIAKPVRGAAPDGFLVSGAEDGFEAREHTDGFFTPDGDWTPVVNESDTWSLIAAPSPAAAESGAYTSTLEVGAVTETEDAGALTDTGGGWTLVIVT